MRAARTRGVRFDVGQGRLRHFTWEVATDTPGQHTDKARVKLPGAIEVPLAPLLDDAKRSPPVNSGMPPVRSVGSPGISAYTATLARAASTIAADHARSNVPGAV